MNIAIWHYLPSGGGKRALSDQVRGLLDRGHRVEAWCPEQADDSFLPLSELIEEHRRPLVEVEPRGLPSAAGAWDQAANVGRNLQALADHCKACADEINRASFDVVFAHSSKSFYMHPMARFTTAPAVIYLHEVFRKLYEGRPSLVWEAPPRAEHGKWAPGSWRRLISDTIRTHGHRIQVREERRAAGEYELILVNSLFSRESVVRTYGLDARVCYLGVDTERFKPDEANRKEQFVLGVGSLYPPKGALLAIEALGRLPGDCRPPLVWVGNFADAGYLDSCQRLARELDVEFDYLELVEEPRLLELLRTARLVVYPSVLEPFGYVPIEASACGTPVVGIAEGGLRETVRDGVNGFLVPNRDPAELAEAIKRVLQPEGSNDYERLCRDARRHAEIHWNQSAAIDRLECCLSQAVAGGGRAGCTSPDSSA